MSEVPMTKTGYPVADSLWAATQAVQALSEGRYALGAAFARIAEQALRGEQAATPAHMGPDHNLFRCEHPDCVKEAREAATAGGAGTNPALRLVDASTAVQPALVPADQPSAGTFVPPITGRCFAVAWKDSVPVECHGAIFLNHADNAWHHIDPSIDHAPLPQQPQQPKR